MPADDPKSPALSDLYSAHLEIQRCHTDEALAATGFDALAIFAGCVRTPFLDDQPYPFRLNPHFSLWTPLQQAADCWIVYRPSQPLTLVFLQPRDYWYKPPKIPNDFWTKHFRIEIIREPREAKSYTHGVGRCAFVGEWHSQFMEWGFADRNPPSLLHRLHYVRARKTAYEIECTRLASAIAARAHRAAEAAFCAGASEYEIHLSYVRASGQTESELPYSNIVALNENAAVLHYQNQERTAPAEPRSFLIDAGARFAGYAADVTRTYSRRNDDFAALIVQMDRLQEDTVSQVRTGMDYVGIHMYAYLRVSDLLKDVDLITVSGAEAAESGLTSVFFPHGIGHLLGLQVHDVGGFAMNADGEQRAPPTRHPYLRLVRTLEPGFIVTIEPGVYFVDSLLDAARGSDEGKHINWRQVERFHRYGGIRIEDNVVCCPDGPENLTRAAFSALT